ncbi:hypothetical protein C0583_06200 [Candidatus Parcubacteria bacterium]|nr:MAG: hypothetical protein C0583_06200 [Candidatus Parcubacteria bacterium]
MDNQTKISIVLFILIIGLLLYNFLVITRKTITNTKWYIKKFGKKIPCIICGHETYLIDKINAHGKSFAFEIPLNNGTTHFCHECLSLLAIECAWCDRQILFEDKTIVYQAMDICLVPKNIKLYFTDPVYIFGCNHEKCVGRHIA